VHDTQALTIDPTAIEVWLRQPSDEHPAFSHAEYLGVHDEVSGPGEEDFLPTIRRVLAAEPDGLHRRADVTHVELWLIEPRSSWCCGSSRRGLTGLLILLCGRPGS